MAWSLQRRLASQQLEFSLLQERLNNAQLAQAGLTAQLDDCREEVAEISEIKADQQAELAALRREADLLQQERQIAREAAQAWSNQREQQEAEIRRLDAQRAALSAELKEQQDSHQQRLSDLQGSRDELRAQFAELAGKIFDEREQRFAETSQQQLGQLLDPLKERIQSFEKRVEESYQQEARERFSLGKELERLQQLNQRLGDEATNLTRALKGQKTQGNWGELVLERVLEHAGLEKGREYQTQVSLKGPDGERFQPDVIIYLPGDKQVVVDSKVSLTAYQQYVAADDDALGRLQVDVAAAGEAAADHDVVGGGDEQVDRMTRGEQRLAGPAQPAVQGFGHHKGERLAAIAHALKSQNVAPGLPQLHAIEARKFHQRRNGAKMRGVGAGEHDLGAFPDEEFHRRAPDAARAPGDQRHLAFDPSCHVLGLLSIRHALAAM